MSLEKFYVFSMSVYLNYAQKLTCLDFVDRFLSPIPKHSSLVFIKAVERSETRRT